MKQKTIIEDKYFCLPRIHCGHVTIREDIQVFPQCISSGYLTQPKSLVKMIPSAVIDCRKYQLLEHSRNDMTCRLLMAVLMHKRHRKKITPSSNWQDVTPMLNGIMRWQPGGKFVSEVNIAHG